MPRAANGTYTLPAGNPVVTGTTISSVWANTTLSDLGTAMTDSLSRSGQGAMTAPLQLANGAIGAPGLTWSTETTSGFYRAGAGDFRFAIAGADIWRIGTGGVIGGFADGAVGTPSIFFTSDGNTGFYRIVADQIGVSLNGVLQYSFVSTALTIANAKILGPVGNAAAPTYSFGTEPDTGMFLSGVDSIGFSAGNSLRLVVEPTGATTTGFHNASTGFRAGNGLVGTPSFSFSGDTTTGFYRSSASEVSVTCGGVQTFAVGPLGQYNIDGTAANPVFKFINDPDTGIYRDGANILAFSAGGVLQMRIRSNTVDLYVAGAITSQLQNGLAFMADGAVGGPSYTFINDTNTGFYRTTAGQIAIALGGVTAGQIAQGTFTGTLTGFTANPTATWTYQRIGRHVSLWCGTNMNATSNSVLMTLTGLPAIIQPATAKMCGTADGNDNSVGQAIVGFVQTGGSITFAKVTALAGLVQYNGAFTAVNNKGLNAGAQFFYDMG